LESSLLQKLELIQLGTTLVFPVLILAGGVLLLILIGLFTKNKSIYLPAWTSILILITSTIILILDWPVNTVSLFGGMLEYSSYAVCFSVLFNVAGFLTVLMSFTNAEVQASKFSSEYFALLVSAVLGAHLLVMSSNLLMLFISLELLSISSYILAGYSLNKKGAEGSLKYFLFGSVASAVMVYGFSILFGLTGTLEFTSEEFINRLITNQSPLFLIASLMALGGFLYKIAAAPMHPWAPDVYEAAPMPVLAFLSTAPKLAGIAILAKFSIALNLLGESYYDWQLILAALALLSITVGNFSALWQQNAKRMMAYSSIAQSGFLLIGLACFSSEGIQVMIFYACVYLLMNYVVFICLQVFENNGLTTTTDFSGVGKQNAFISIILLIGFIALAGIPPTGGFTGKLFIFTALWDAYSQTGKDLLLWLLIFGLINTVVSLFYYLKIPYYSFIQSGEPVLSIKTYNTTVLLALILTLAILLLFIQPGLLMGWLNRITFVL
jgi:NADH-quinone oxidoreductase subunit N